MSQKQPAQRGVAIVETLIILFGVVVIFATGWFVWHSRENASYALNNASSVGNGVSHPRKAVKKTATTLEIKELGVKLQLSADASDAYYAKTVSGNTTSYVLSIHALDGYSGCVANSSNPGVSAVQSFTPGFKDELVGDYDKAFPNAPLIKGRKFYIMRNQYDCTLGKDTATYTKAVTAFQNATISAL